MKMVYVIVLASVLLLAGAWVMWPGKKYPETCWSEKNFDSVLRYVEWKDRTSKIGKVLVNRFTVKIQDGNILVFKKDKTEDIQFTISKEQKIKLEQPVKKTDTLMKKAEGVFCELLERAKFRGY